MWIRSLVVACVLFSASVSAQPDPLTTNLPSTLASNLSARRSAVLETLVLQAGERERGRRVLGPISLAAGAMMFAPAIAGFADGAYGSTPSAGWLQLGIGTLALVQGAVWLAIQTSPEERLARYRRAQESGLDRDEVARFEGELRGRRTVARMERALFMWSGIGLLFGGTLQLIVQSQSDAPQAHQRAGYAFASLYAATGLGLLVYSFVPSPSERRPVQFGLAPLSDQGRVAGANLQITGAF